MWFKSARLIHSYTVVILFHFCCVDPKSRNPDPQTRNPNPKSGNQILKIRIIGNEIRDSEPASGS
jgi:hypothetical protein